MISFKIKFSSKKIIGSIIIVTITNLVIADMFNLSSRYPKINIAEEHKENNIKSNLLINNTSFKNKFLLKKIIKL